MGRGKIVAALAALLGLWCAPPAEAGFRSPESLVRNVYAHYGPGAPAYSQGLPRDADTAQRFFDPSLRAAWTAPREAPYDFLVQGRRWKLGPVSITVARKQYDRTYVSAAFDNQGRAVTLSFIAVNTPEGWVILDVESPHDSLRLFLAQFKR